MDKFLAPPNRHYVELPSIEEIAEMDKQREYAIDRLEISSDSTQVRDILRRLPLHSSRMTGYRWVCSKCWDETERSKQNIKPNKYPLLF